ncbi:PorP/SprF family type IX secretion system membrane protein [Flavilitoribacter nigricans]|uniref:Type IX secretion system membrane protein PorP/SprF n=1 Tax=Flavilitoribacter nigricans (strain ATCC 23147 / DSM 23189 / NBRC 102662 / NCIMB 1420 / SS-2) TaxID=1122177 RepID=A0A2D0MZG5_FLAN2|nr:PorP/SprF family type IX secretion system membrane protein [Flavilitoribacter nigricans]PHN01682.1 hypothetical protein CRP01_35635 [Flavilitoribacter nigricans DSM 23189 = NBRC 102662]
MKNLFAPYKIGITQLFFIAMLFCFCRAEAQQLPAFTIYRDHWNVINPASLSNNYLVNEWYFSAGASYRQQWWNAEGSPNTQVLNFEAVLPEYDQIVTGGHIIRHQTGLIDQTGLYGQFAYRIEMGRRTEQALVFGLNAGIVQYRANLSDIQFADAELGPLERDLIYHPDFSLGAFYYHSDLFYAGISVPQVFGLNTTFRDTTNNEFNIQRIQHMYGVVGGYIPVSWFGTEASFLEPSAWIRYVPGSPVSIDANLRYQISDFYWVGLGAGSGTGAAFSARLHLETGMILGESLNIYAGQFKIGIGFDIPLGVYRSAFGNSAELNLIYSWE